MPEINVGINAKGAEVGAKRVNKSLNSMTKNAKNVNASTGKMGTVMSGAMGSFLPIAAAGAAIGGLAKNVIGVTDKYTNLKSQLEYVTGSSEGAVAAQKSLFIMSQNTATAVDGNAKALILLSQANSLTGNTTGQNIGMLEKLNILMKKTGVSGVNASASMLQLSQALGSGVLAGDEFKSLSENFPALMDQIAKSIGIPRGELKAYAADQKLTTEVVMEAINGINSAHEGLPKTAAAGWQKVVNSWENAVSKIGMENGVSGLLYEALETLSGWMDTAMDTFGPTLNSIGNVFVSMWDIAGPAIMNLVDTVKNEFGSVLTWMQTDGAPVVQFFGDTLSLAFNTAAKAISFAATIIKKQIEGVMKVINMLLGAINSVVQSKIVQGGLSIARSVVGGGSEENKTSAEKNDNISGGNPVTVNVSTPLNASGIANLTKQLSNQGARL